MIPEKGLKKALLLFEPYIDHGAFGDKNIERLRVRVTSYGFSADATMNLDYSA